MMNASMRSGLTGVARCCQTADARGKLARMHVTMVKKKLADGSDCRKCAEVSAYLGQHGFSDRIDEVVWAHENDPDSPGMVLGKRLGVERAPFFVVRDERGETVYRSVLQLIQERFGQQVSSGERARDVDPDDVGGI